MTAAVALPVTQGTDEWLAMRRMGVGSSDAPVIAGESGSVVELWAEKAGLVDRAPVDDATARLFEWGHRLEPVVADWYADTTGRPLRRVNQMLRHPEVPWAFASLDRVTARGEKRIVEIKTTRWGWDAPEVVPGRVQTQVQHQLWVTGYDVADVAVLTGGSEPQIYEIARDDRFIDDLVFLETEFWGWVTSLTRPPMDGSENARRVLSQLYPRNNGAMLLPTPELDAVVSDWLAAKAAKEEAEARAETLGNTLRALIGEAEGIQGRVTWKKNADSERVDWPTVAGELRRIAQEVVPAETLDALKSLHTRTVEGVRVLRPVSKGSTR